MRKFLKSLLDVASSASLIVTLFGIDLFAFWLWLQEEIPAVLGRQLNEAEVVLIVCLASSYLVGFGPPRAWTLIKPLLPGSRFKNLTSEIKSLLWSVESELEYSRRRKLISSDLKSKLISFETKARKFKIECPEVDTFEDLIEWAHILPFFREFSKLGDVKQARACLGALKEGIL